MDKIYKEEFNAVFSSQAGGGMPVMAPNRAGIPFLI